MAWNSVLPNALHLYRAILRECSYLPDPAAREFFHRYAVSRFQKWVPNKHRKYSPVGVYKQVKLQARARNRLSMLRRANEGYLQSLEIVLKWTYGRSGPRRHELLRPFSMNHVPDIPSTDKPVERYSQGWTPGPMFEALVQAHISQAGMLNRSFRGGTKLTKQSQIPTKNSWGLPMPKVRQPNLLRRWFGKTSFLMLPPLPPDEYERLGKLAVNPPAENEIVRKRRTKVGNWNTQASELLSESFLLNGPRRDVTTSDFVNGRPHQITPRIMSRLWASIYTNTPHLTWSRQKAGYSARFRRVSFTGQKGKTNALTTVSNEQSNILFGD